MKFHTKNTTIERSNIQAESAFTIKTTAKAFDILSSGLYTDPITAIIRELSCNAYDAHVASGNETTPFDIHLPNAIEPFFYVKDYGVGLSDTQIRGELIPVLQEDNGELIHVTDDSGKLRYQTKGGLYTTYFDSTKNDSNDFIGALGLGSKSPFSYTTAFDVISIFNGIKSIYSIFLNEDGIPTVALMGQSNTNDHNGVEVRLTVEQKDFRSFEAATASVLRYFPTKPNVKGVPSFQFIKTPKETLKGDDWFIAPSHWNHDKFTAVQGHVPYRVNTNQLTKHLTKAEVAVIDSLTIVAIFNIGELDVAANREEIRYDNQTVQVLCNRIRQIHQNLISIIEKEINKHKKSYWDACIRFNDMANELFNSRYTMIKLIKSHSTKLNPLLEKIYESNGNAEVAGPIRGHELISYKCVGSGLSRSVVTNIRPSIKTKVFYNDIKVKGISRVREFLKTSNDVNEVIVINPLKEPLKLFKPDTLTANSTKQQLVPFIGYDKEYKLIVQQLGKPTIATTSSLNPPQPKPVTRKFTYFKYGTTRSVGSYWNKNLRVDWERCDDTEIPNGGLFFFLEYGCYITKFLQKNKSAGSYDDRYHISNNSCVWEPAKVKNNLQAIVNVINQVQKTNYALDDEVFGATLTAYKHLEKNNKWTDIFVLFDKCIPDLLKQTIPISKFNITPNLYNIKDAIKQSDFMQRVNKLDNKSHFKQTVMMLHDYYLLTKKANNNSLLTVETIELIIDYCDIVGIPLPSQSKKPIFDENAFDKYPMLEYIGSLNSSRYHHNSSKMFNTLFDYITVIDRSS